MNYIIFSSGRRGFFNEYGGGSGNNEENNSETGSEGETDKENDVSSDVEEESDADTDFDPSLDFSEIGDDDFDPSLDFSEIGDDDFDPSLDFSEVGDDDFDPSLDFNGPDENQEGDGFEPIADSDDSQKPESDGNADDINDQPSSSEQENESYENLNSESTSTVLIGEAKEEGECMQNDNQNQEETEEISQEELEKEIEKELEKGVEAINQHLEQEAEFINAYQKMVAEAREQDGERESEGQEPLKTEEEWEKEIETTAYTAEQLYEGINESESDSNSEDLSEPNEEPETEKETEQSAEVPESQLSDLQEEFEVGMNEIEQHQVDPLIEEALEAEPEPMINEKEIEQLQELDLEEQFSEVHEKEEMEELIEWQDEQIEREKEEEVEAQTDNSEEIVSELEEEFEEGMNEIEQHQVDPLIKEALEAELEPMINEKEIEQLQELDIEEQFQAIEFNDLIKDLAEQQEEDKIEQEKENLEQTQEIIHQTTYLQENLEELEQELEMEYEEKIELERHQVEAAIEEELETEPKPIIREEELEYVKNFEPEKQLEAELFYELIEKLKHKENEEKEEDEELSTEEKVAQIKFKLGLIREIKSGETEVEPIRQEEVLEHETNSSDVSEQNKRIEQEVLNEIGSEEDDLEQATEDNHEKLKKLYKQQTGKRPIYAGQETKGYKQWLEQRKEMEKKEKEKQEQDLKEERKEEEVWKRTLKNRIEEASEIEPELKSKLLKLVEKYNELEKLIKKYSQLYNKAQRKELSQTEKSELNSLVEALLKLDPIKMELFIGLREIKRYIDKDDYYYYEYWNNQRHYKVFSHFFTQLSQRYKNIKEVQKIEIIEEILENWIEETSEEEISLEMKVVLIKILENYNELEELTSNFMKLYKKEQLGQISQSDKSKLRSLSKTLGKLSPIKIELLTNIRAIKRYLKDQDFDDFSNKSRISQIVDRFLKKSLQKYNKLDLNKTETLNTGKIHSEIIKKLKNVFKQEDNSKELSISKLSNLVKGLSLTQFKKLKTTTKSLRYATYLEFYYFIKQAYENNNIEHEKWKEMKKLFKILFETTTNNTKSLPSQYELENFLYPSYVEPIWELWNSLEWEKYQNSHVLLKRYWRRYCNHIAIILIEYCQKFTNIPFKAYVLKEEESKWKEIQEGSKIQKMNLSSLEKNLSQLLNIDLEKDILEIRLLNKKYQYKLILENSVYNAEDFLNELRILISSFIRKNLVKEHIVLQINNKLERVNLIRGTNITQYALSFLMEEDKEYVEKVIKQNLRYNEHYIINFACLSRLSKNINSIFKENEKKIKEISNATKSIQEIIKYYIERNQVFYSAKNEVIIQNHPNIILKYFNRIYDEKFTMEERLEAAYWLGFVFADGYITINARDKKTPKEFGINLSIQDKSQLVKFCLAIGANPTFIRNVITSEKDGKSYYASIFRIYNETFCKIMENHGVVRKKSKIIELPEQFKTLKKNNDGLKMIFLSFLLGYYDGDGIVNRNTIISGSKKFLKQINNVLVNAFGANLKSEIDERTEGNYYLNIERKIKQYMENVFQNSLERKRRYAKGKYSENIDQLILKLIIQNLNELPISEMIKIYNDVIEKLSLPKYLKLSANNLKRILRLKGYKIHNKTWYISQNLNLRLNANTFKKKILEFLDKIN